MNTFLKFMERTKTEMNYGYCALRPTVEFANEISYYLASKGIDAISPQQLHCTLMYDPSNPVSSSEILTISKPQEQYEFNSTKIAVLGNAVALIIESNSIQERCKELSEYFVHSYDSHLLHISLVYSDSEKDLQRINTYLNNSDILERFKSGILQGEYFEALQ